MCKKNKFVYILKYMGVDHSGQEVSVAIEPIAFLSRAKALKYFTEEYLPAKEAEVADLCTAEDATGETGHYSYTVEKVSGVDNVCFIKSYHNKELILTGSYSVMKLQLGD